MKKLEQRYDFKSLELHAFESKLLAYKKQFGEFAENLDESKQKIDKTLLLYEFFDKVRRSATVYFSDYRKKILVVNWEYVNYSINSNNN